MVLLFEVECHFLNIYKYDYILSKTPNMKTNFIMTIHMPIGKVSQSRMLMKVATTIANLNTQVLEITSSPMPIPSKFWILSLKCPIFGLDKCAMQQS